MWLSLSAFVSTGVNLWPRLSGSNSTPPRQELWGGPNFLISGNFKLVLGESVTYAVWTGPHSPNATTELEKQFFLQWNCTTCSPPVILGRVNCSTGCLCAFLLKTFMIYFVLHHLCSLIFFLFVQLLWSCCGIWTMHTPLLTMTGM